MLVESQIILLVLFNILFLQLIKQKFLNNIINFFLTIFLCLQLISYYLTGDLIDYRFLIHTNLSSIENYIFQFKLESLLLIIVGFFIFLYQLKFKNFQFKKKRTSFFILFFLITCLSINSNTMFRQLYEIVIIYNNGLIYKFIKNDEQKNTNIENFINKTSLNKSSKHYKTLDSKLGNNLVVINLESLDTGFIFGTPNLTKNLNLLKNEMNFKKVKPINGCNWTVGSLYCLMTGIPGYFPSDGNRIFQGVERINLINLGYIFSTSGYKNLDYFVGESKFSGQGDLMRAFGFEVYDSIKLKDKIKVYPKTFGYHDYDLFNELKNKILEYKYKEDTFAIFASSINTHLSGIDDKRLKFDENNKLSTIEKSVFNLDYLVNDFVKFLKKENLYENITLIFLTDHLYPNNKTLSKISSKLNKSDRSLFILTNQKKDLKNNISQLDLSRTVLNLTDIKHDHTFFSDNKNQTELDEIIKNNKFYLSEFNKKNIKFSNNTQNYKFEIKNNIFRIFRGNILLQEENLTIEEPSFINLVFDKDLNYKPLLNIETKNPKEIRIEDEKGEYKHIILFKNKNKVINGQYVETKKKIFKKINVDKQSFSLNLEEIDENAIYKNYANDKKRFIAHAGGEVENKKYLNSLEGLNLNYDKGFKNFELDLMLTSDGFLVAVHDWDFWKRNTNYNKSLPPTLAEFKKYKLYDKYSPPDYLQITEWFNDRPDAVLITDKIDNPLLILDQIPIDKDNLRMELFSINSINLAKKNGLSVIVNIDVLKEIKNPAKYLEENNLEYVAISQRHTNKLKASIFNNIRNKFSHSLEKKLSDIEVKFLVYGLNDEKNITEKDILCKYNDIYYGMYADKWDFEKEFKCY